MFHSCKRLCLWALLLTCLPCFAQGEGKITAVTVFRGQALVTRAVSFQAKGAGTQETVVTNIPAGVIPGSLYGVGDNTVAVRGVRYRETAVGEEPREDIRALDEQLAKHRRTLRRIDSDLAVLDTQNSFLAKMQESLLVAAKDDKGRAVLDPKAAQQSTEFVFQQGTAIAQQRFALISEKEDTNTAVNLLERKRGQLTAGWSKSVREAVVTLDVAKPGATTFDLCYLVQNVTWAPVYSARITRDHSKLALEYNAVVSQLSGEDWSNVKLTLTTTNPTMSAMGPLLSPLYVSLTGGATLTVVSDVSSFTEARAHLNTQLNEGFYNDTDGRFPQVGQGPQGPSGPQGAMSKALAGEQYSFDYMTPNILAGRMQNMELAASDDVVRKAREIEGRETTLAVTYAITGTISLQSRDDQQLLRIATLNLKPDYYYSAIPLLTDAVYQAADAENTSDIALLPGPFNAYIDDVFAGQGQLPLVVCGDTMTIGFGVESQLRVQRELVNKSTEYRGGNMLVAYQYRLRMENYAGAPVKIRLLDRIPAPNGSVILTLGDMQTPLSTDEAYLADQRPLGLLRWDVEVPAHVTGTKALAVDYNFKLEFDKNYQIGELSDQGIQQMKDEFQRLNNASRSRSGR